ncbi:MAG TPA: Rab family GTPase [Spirochaetota bacterium]|nr:Rab family GTPase [Spirochaetota bacterium]
MASGYKWKVVMVGDFAVGKTSLVRRFVYDEFSDSYLTTIGVKVTKKEVAVSDAISADLLLWDIAGSDKFTKILPEYIRGASAGIIVADLTRRNTIENIPEHAELLRSENPYMDIYVALNKSDLVENAEEYVELAEDGTKGKNIKLTITTSAKDGSNIDDLFTRLFNSLLEGIQNE